MKTIICTIAVLSLLGLSHVANAQNFAWAKKMGGTGTDFGNSITLDPFGNIYSIGSFQDSVDFDPGIGTFQLTSKGGYDIYISKSDASGNLIWAKQMGGPEDDRVNSIALDASGNVYTTGVFKGTSNFNPGAGTVNLTSKGGNDIFITKLDALGNSVWAKQMGGPGDDNSSELTLDPVGSVFTTGFFEGVADLDPGAGIYNLTSIGGRDIFISKLNAAGSFVWAKRMGGNSEDYSTSIALDASGNILTTGTFIGSGDFDPGVGSFTLTSQGTLNYFSDIYISKLDASGNFIWAKRIGGPNSMVEPSIALDAFGNVYSTGNFSATVDFDPGLEAFTITAAGTGLDIFVSKLDASGNFIWAKNMGGNETDICAALALDAEGSVYTTGYFAETADFDPSAGIFNLTSAGSLDVFVSKLDAMGNFLWATSLGGVSADYSSSIALDQLGSIFISGAFNVTVDFDPGAGTFNLTSLGNDDIFTLKLSNPTTLIPDEVQNDQVRVYPNPADKELFIEIGSYTNSIADVYNMEGQLKQHIALQANQTALPVNQLPNGLYFVKVRSSEGTITKKFIKN